VVNRAQKYLETKIKSGEFELPPGTSYKFAGSYENQVRSEKKLMIVLPISLFIIFLIPGRLVDFIKLLPVINNIIQCYKTGIFEV